MSPRGQLLIAARSLAFANDMINRAASSCPPLQRHDGALLHLVVNTLDATRRFVAETAEELPADPGELPEFDFLTRRDAIAALIECADDLETEIEARRNRELPRRIERDLGVVKRARGAIAYFQVPGS
ncbi:MAG TPA: hypothetical protein VGG68_00930 [Caulobacteraceae bacterium]|jgi:hypothetical protein